MTAIPNTSHGSASILVSWVLTCGIDRVLSIAE
jgi:hypothetical protein